MRRERTLKSVLEDDYKCKIEFDYKANAYEITYKDSYFRTHADKSLLKSIEGIKYYPEKEMKNLLDKDVDYKEAYTKVNQHVLDLQDLKEMCHEIIERNYCFGFPYKVIEY